MNSHFLRAAAAALTMVLSFAPAHAAGSHDGGHDKTLSLGQPAAKADADRTVEVVMYDNSYEPEKIAVKAGETIRFKVRNAGELVHEFGIGTTDRFKGHMSEMMAMMRNGVFSATEIMKPGKMHQSGGSVMLEPGDKATLVWSFPDGGEVDLRYACTVPGHYEAGMKGDFRMRHGS